MYFFISFIVSCSKEKECINANELIFNQEKIPVLNLPLNTHTDILRKELDSLFGKDLCEICGDIEYKIPITIDKKEGFIKVQTEFENPYCKDCPPYQKLKRTYSIDLDKRNRLYVEGYTLPFEEFEKQLDTFYYVVDSKEHYYFDSIDDIIFDVDWSQETDLEMIDSVLVKILKNHKSFILKKNSITEEKLCSLESADLQNLKSDHPLRIELNLGRSDAMSKSIRENFDQLEEIEKPMR